MSDTIDITPLKETGLELRQAIYNAVQDTQSAVLLTPLPNILIMTFAQYENLDPYGDMVGAYQSKQRIYITRHEDGKPLNAMDVVVKDPPQ